MSANAVNSGTAMKTVDLTPSVGTEVLGVDLSQPLGADTIRSLRRAVAERGVLVFRDQRLTLDEHISFASQFGPLLEENNYLPTLEGHSEISVLASQGSWVPGGELYHCDWTFRRDPPALGVLVPQAAPEGASTFFASMRSAWAALSPGLREALLRLRLVHSNAYAKYSHVRRGLARGLRPETFTHPAVVKHPVTGEATLFLSSPMSAPRFDGWSEAESRPLLAHLHASAVEPEHVVRIGWTPDMVIVWDNVAVLHRATRNHSDQPRIQHRAQVLGVPLEAYAGAASGEMTEARTHTEDAA